MPSTNLSMKILSLVTLSLFITSSFLLLSPSENFVFLQKAEARPSRAESAQNLAKKKQKIAKKRTKKNTKKITNSSVPYKSVIIPKNPPASVETAEKYSAKQLEALRWAHKLLNDSYRRMVNEANQYEPTARKQLFDILDSYNEKLGEFEKYHSISLERKLTTKESLEESVIGGAIGALLDQFNKVKNGAFTGIISKQDPDAAFLLQECTERQTSLSKKIDFASGYQPTTALRLLDVLKEEIALVKSFCNYAVIAQGKNLSTIESNEVNALLEQITAKSEEFLSVQQQDVSQPSPSYTPNSQPQNTHQQMCDSMIATAAINGSANSSGTSQQLYNAGCISLNQYCSGFAMSNWAMPAECK